MSPSISKKRIAQIFFLGMIPGLIVFFCIYGFAVLNPTNDSWITHSADLEGIWDLTQHYLGWCFYRKSPWTFPIGLTEGLYSSPVSVAYTDSIPLLAIIFKLLSPLLPETFQYFGIHALICYLLMGGFGGLITLGVYDWAKEDIKTHYAAFVSLIGSSFFVLSPVLLKRILYHSALSSHYLVLMALALWIYRDSISRKFYNIYWLFLGILAVTINPYYVPMVLGILLCSNLQELMDNAPFRPGFLTFVTSLAGILVTGWAIGLFSGEVSASAGGLNDLSFNILQLVNPRNYQLSIQHRNYVWTNQDYSAFLPGLPNFSAWQEEGFSYFGLGMIIILLLAGAITFALWFRYRRQTEFSVPQKRRRRSYGVSMGICMIVFGLLAMSPSITFGPWQLLNIQLPDWLYRIWSMFRSTGRMIWPAYFLIMGLSFYMLFRVIKGKRELALFLCGMLLLQVVDLMPAMEDKHEVYTNLTDNYYVELSDSVGDAYALTDTEDIDGLGQTKPLNSSLWKELGENADEIYFYTPVMYGLYCDPGISCIFEEYALEYDLSLNATYMSRDTADKADAATLAHFESRAAGKGDSSKIYIFFDISDIPDTSVSGLNYYVIDNYIVGTEMELDLEAE